MPASAAVLKSEARLFGREPGSLFWIVVFPTVLLTILGLIPSFREADASIGGRRVIDLYVPVAVLLAMIMAGLQAMPPILTGYRERGILRRMSTTSVRPASLLTAQIVLHGAAAALCSAVLAMAVGRVAFGVALPEQLFGYALALVLATLSALALGATVSALSRNTKASSAGFEVVGEASDGIEGIALAARLDPDVVLMDLRMPGGRGVDAIAELARRGLRCKVLVLTTYDTDSDTLAAIEAGATGYLLKAAPRDELFAAVRAAAEGRTVLSPAIASRLVSRVRAPVSQSLSTREREVLRLVAKGTSNREIAAVLFISEATVKTHLTHIYGKLGVKDRAAAVAVAYDRGILG